jgi:hypothetical protein
VLARRVVSDRQLDVALGAVFARVVLAPDLRMVRVRFIGNRVEPPADRRVRGPVDERDEERGVATAPERDRFGAVRAQDVADEDELFLEDCLAGAVFGLKLMRAKRTASGLPGTGVQEWTRSALQWLTYARMLNSSHAG